MCASIKLSNQPLSAFITGTRVHLCVGYSFQKVKIDLYSLNVHFLVRNFGASYPMLSVVH